MKVGDRVRVTRMDEQTLQIYERYNIPSRVGMEGVITEMNYNAPMKREEVVVKTGEEFWIWQPWQLEVIE